MKASINYLSTQESSGSYYPEVAGNPKVPIELASDVQLVKNRARPPLLTVPTRRAKAEKLSRKVKGESVKRKEVKSLQGVVRESLSKHAEKRAEAEAKIEDNADINILAIGEEEVDKVKELGIDRTRKVKKSESKSNFGDMLKTGLNTLNTIQTMSKVFGGSESGSSGGGGGGGGKNVVMDLVGSLLTGGDGGKGTKSQKRSKSPLDPLVDSAFDLLGGEEATGGLRRFAKPFLKNLIQSNT